MNLFGYNSNKTIHPVLGKNIDEVTTGNIQAQSFEIGDEVTTQSRMVEKENITPFSGSALDILKEVEVVNFTEDGVKKIGINVPVDSPLSNLGELDIKQTIAVIIKAIQEISSSN